MKFLLVLLSVQAAMGATVFSDDFESGALIAERWANPGSGFIATDPVVASNHALSFGYPASGGDVFSVFIPKMVNTYRLNFDFYAEVAASPFNIGYVGTDHQTFPWGPYEQWHWNSAGLEPGNWHHVDISISPLTEAAFTLKLEAFGSLAPTGIFFDNIQLDDMLAASPVPEPSGFLLALAGAGVLLAYRRQKPTSR